MLCNTGQTFSEGTVCYTDPVVLKSTITMALQALKCGEFSLVVFFFFLERKISIQHFCCQAKRHSCENTIFTFKREVMWMSSSF